MKLGHIVCTYNQKGFCQYEQKFNTAEEAYAEFESIVKTLSELPAEIRKTHETMVIRYRDGYPMNVEIIN